eukprot:1156411-Pelagomonas_calceolata.AAC.3
MKPGHSHACEVHWARQSLFCEWIEDRALRPKGSYLIKCQGSVFSVRTSQATNTPRGVWHHTTRAPRIRHAGTGIAFSHSPPEQQCKSRTGNCQQNLCHGMLFESLSHLPGTLERIGKTHKSKRVQYPCKQ